MNSKIDVLAVMDRAFGAANEKYDDLRSEAGEPPLGNTYLRVCRFMQEHRAARAAVAELIEAAQAMRLEASRLRGDCIPADTLADFDAALTRVTGA